MVKHAHSKERRAQDTFQAKTSLQKQAVDMWKNEHENPTGPGGKPLSLRSVCDTVSAAYQEKTGEHIAISYSTLSRHIKGSRTQAEFNGKKSWVSDGEATALIDYALQMAGRNFPFSHRRLEEHANEIISAKMGGSFGGVGKNWVDRFIVKHNSRLKLCWSSALDSSRARAVNPQNHKAFFMLYNDIKHGSGNIADAIPDNLIYAADETGIQKGIGVRERVLAPTTVSIQHQQRSGDRENITVLPTICADGTYLTPTTIFKGDGYRLKWCQDNPLNSSLGYSKKGYTDGEIGVAWIEDFDKQTKIKANGKYRLLLLDGHNSHYTRGFLEYARTNKIHVLCYPSHSTHVYQGLDVVIFSVLKRYWSEERDKFERETKTKISKENFLRVYAAAHIRAFTPENIKAAFQKTGIVPFNPDAITPAMMEPSLETSIEGAIPLSSQQTSPVRAVSQLLQEHMQRKRRTNEIENIHGIDPRTPQRRRFNLEWQTPEGVLTPSPVRRTLFDLQASSAAFLVSPLPIQSTSSLPSLLTAVISPSKTRYAHLLKNPPRNILEEELMNALHMNQQQIDILKENNRILQAQTVLQNMYVGSVRAELQGSEQKKHRKSGKKLNSDGLPKLLSGDEFYQKVVEHNEKQRRDAEEKEQRRTEREGMAAMREQWNEEEEARKERNSKVMEAWQKEVKMWEIERNRAKEAHQRPRWNKPARPRAEPAKPKTWIKRSMANFTSTADVNGDDESLVDDEGSGDEDEDDDDD